MRKMLAASVALFLYSGVVQAMTPAPTAAPEEDCYLCCPRWTWVCFETPLPKLDWCEVGIGGC